MHCAARAVWAQFELLLLQQRVLYIKSAAHTNQAKLGMVATVSGAGPCRSSWWRCWRPPWRNGESNEDES